MSRSPRLLAAALCFCAMSTSFGQDVRASISGVVTDPSGAPVIAAIVIFFVGLKQFFPVLLQ